MVWLAVVLSSTGWARGTYFHVFPLTDAGVEVIAESAPVSRCVSGLISKETQGDRKKIAACRIIDGLWLVALVEGHGLRVRAFGSDGLRWERQLNGALAFQEENLFVLTTATGLRAVWLSLDDGATIRAIEFLEQKGPSLRRCDDGLLKWFRAEDGTTAAICRVLD